MNSTLRSFLVTGAATAALACAASAIGRGSHDSPPSPSNSSTYTPEINSGPDSLRQIVQNQCVVNWTQKHDPAPCERVFLPDMDIESPGYALLADRKGGAHYLLVPTRTMAGLDSTELLDRDMPNYFAEAWHARDLITKFVGHPVPRTKIGLAVNTANSRTQTQFHIHIECLRPDVFASLSASTDQIGDTWAPLMVAGATYRAMRVMGDGLDGSSPFELLAGLAPDVRHHMGDYTLVAAGMQFKSGPGFVLLTGTGPTGELLLDGSCSVAGGGG